jgi:hypothetical protein
MDLFKTTFNIFFDLNIVLIYLHLFLENLTL